MIHSRSRFSLIFFAIIVLAGCVTMPPGSYYPKTESTAFAHPEQTRLGRQLDARVKEHPGLTGIRLFPQGIDGFLVRAETTAAAERSLDIQYFRIQNDDTGKLLMDAVLRAADRGVRVRLLVDDTDDIGRDRQITALAAQPNVEVRVFNPFVSRGVFSFLRYPEFALTASRLNYRMHNKLFVVDNSLAIIGGRNVGDEYFQASEKTEFGDFDVLVAGAAVKPLSASFDAYWNSELAIPIQALTIFKPGAQALQSYRAALAENRTKMEDTEYVRRLKANDPFNGILAGATALVWAKAEVLYDSPEKGKVEAGDQAGRLMRVRVGQAIRDAKSELLIVSPYFVPGDGGVKLLKGVRDRHVRVRVITNSLASTDMPIAHAGYQHYRVPLLEDGVELYEVRPLLGEPDGKAGSLKSPSSGRYALHAKIFVFDRQRLFIGSMNFDRRSLRLNTEAGLLIDSPQLARQLGARFDAIAQPANSYVLALGAPDVTGHRPLIWRTEESGRIVESEIEPMGSLLRGVKAEMLTLLPIDDLL